MIDKENFLTSYNIEPEELKAAGLEWEELAAIYDDYLSVEGKLRSIGKDFVYDYLYDIERAGIHSYRYRTKDPGHLIEKIIGCHTNIKRRLFCDKSNCFYFFFSSFLFSNRREMFKIMLSK